MNLILQAIKSLFRKRETMTKNLLETMATKEELEALKEQFSRGYDLVIGYDAKYNNSGMFYEVCVLNGSYDNVRKRYDAGILPMVATVNTEGKTITDIDNFNVQFGKVIFGDGVIHIQFYDNYYCALYHDNSTEVWSVD